MSLQGIYRRRRSIGLSALMGLVLYASLIPLHTVSQITIALITAKLGDSYQVLCATGTPVNPDGPGVPETKCPYCKGLATFHMALPAVAIFVITPVICWVAIALEHKHSAASALRPSPQSRGPPSGSV